LESDETTKFSYSTLTTQYRMQFLDGSATVIPELIADARNAAGAIELIANIDWPPNAVSIRVLDADGLEVHSASRRDVTG